MSPTTTSARETTDPSTTTTPAALPTTMPTTAPTTVGTPRGVRRSREVHAIMAGFIVWLAQRGLPAEQRVRYHRAAERFLSWQAGHHHCPLGHPLGHRYGVEDSWHCYQSALRLAGHSRDELIVAGNTVAFLHAYLTTTHDTTTHDTTTHDVD